MLKKRKKIFIFILVTLVVIASVSYYFLKNKKTTEYLTTKAEIKQLLQTVGETGTVKSINDLDLNFSNSGKLAKIYVKVGDKVKSGQILAELDYGNIKNKEKEVSASVDVAKANLAKLLSGSTAEDKKISERSVDQAKSSYDAALRDKEKTEKTNEENIKQAEKKLNDLENKTDGYTTAYEQAINTANKNLSNAKATYQAGVDNAEDSVLIAIEEKMSICSVALDNIAKILNDEDVNDFLSVKNPLYINNSKSSYSTANSSLVVTNLSLQTAKIKKETIPLAVNDINSTLNSTLSSLNNMYKALENTITSTQFTQAELDAYKASINTQITLVNSGISNIKTVSNNLSNAKLSYNANVSSAEENLSQAQANYNDALVSARNALSSARINSDQSIASAQSRIDSAGSAWEVSKAQYNKVLAGPSSQDILLSQAQLRQAEASLETVRKQIDDSIIKSPIDAVITKVNFKIGEQITPSNVVISLLTENNFNVEVDISEADIEKISVGNGVEITLDAFGEDMKLFGTVSSIDPAETVIQEVIYYKLKVNFSQESLSKLKQEGKMIKSGMTANVIITASKKDNVLVAPVRSVIEKDSKKIIRILVNNLPEEKEVVLGMQGDGGLVEVVQGIKEGDVIITSIKENK